MRAVFQVMFVVLVHIIVINALKIKVGKWEQDVIHQLFIVYLIPVILLYVTSRMSLARKKNKYNLLWICKSTIPSISFLVFLSNDKGSSGNRGNFVELKFDSGVIELGFFSFICLIIQISLIILLWILKFPKDFDLNGEEHNYIS